MIRQSYMLVKSDKRGWTKAFPWPAFHVSLLAGEPGLILERLREPKATFSTVFRVLLGGRHLCLSVDCIPRSLYWEKHSPAVPGGQPLLGSKGQAHNVKQAVKSLQPLFSLYTPCGFSSLRSPSVGKGQVSFYLLLLNCILSISQEQKPASVKYILGAGCDPDFCSPGG